MINEALLKVIESYIITYQETKTRNSVKEQTPKSPKIDFSIWEDVSRQKKFLDELAQRLKITSIDDWRKVDIRALKTQTAFSAIVNVYGGSFMKGAVHLILTDLALSVLYPEQGVTRGNVRKGYWLNMEIQRKYFDRIGRSLGMQSYEDWYKVQRSDLQDKAGHEIIRYYNGSIIKGENSFTMYTKQHKRSLPYIQSIHGRCGSSLRCQISFGLQSKINTII